MWNNIGSLVGGKVFETVKLLGGVHEEIEDINEQLESIQVFINGADRMAATTEQEKKGDNGMKRKVKDLRDVALRIEDVSEDYMIIQQQQPQNDLGCIAVLYAAANFFKTMIPRLRICYEIQDIKTRIREVDERSGLQIQPFLEQGSSSGSHNVPSQHALRRNALYVEEDDVVGFEAPKHELIGWLNETQPKRTVIIVVGMGGQGKTTLAKTVYDKNLETLDLRELLESWSMEINKLKKLRHLLTTIPMIVMGGVRGLESLQTLYRVDAFYWEEELFEELKELKQLRWLGIYYVNPNYIRNLCYSINNMQHLEKLQIHVWRSMNLDCISPLPTLQNLQLMGGLERFEEWIPKHRNLVKLTLLSSNLSDDPMKSLMHLPNLLSLFLRSAYEGETLHFINGGFHKLKKLRLQELSNLNSIHIGEGALPSLKELKLVRNDILKDIPYGMGQLGKLQVLCIHGMPEEFANRVRENVWIKKNIPKVEVINLLDPERYLRRRLSITTN